MDFERVLNRLLEEFERQGIRYAVMGGVALGALGVPRATVDIDFRLFGFDTLFQELRGRYGHA